MFYIYILQSLSNPDKTYVGFTENIERRLSEHNAGSQVYSHRYAPWDLLAYTAFKDRISALAFELYLKSGSGKAFLTKHFLSFKS